MRRDVAPYGQQTYEARSQVASNTTMKYINYKVTLQEGGALAFIEPAVRSRRGGGCSGRTLPLLVARGSTPPSRPPVRLGRTHQTFFWR